MIAPDTFQQWPNDLTADKQPRVLVAFPLLLQAPAAEEVSIAPDKFQQWPHDLNETTKLALYPQPINFLFDLFERGRADALAWAQQQGFPQEVLQKLVMPAAADTAAAAAGDAAAAAGEEGSTVEHSKPYLLSDSCRWGVVGGVGLVPADAAEVPAELRVARVMALEQQQELGSDELQGQVRQQQQQQQAAVAVAEVGAQEAAASVGAAAR
jgi:hypothetical protein